MKETVSLPRAVVVDDHPEMLNKVKDLLNSEFNIVATASDGASALELIHRLDPDVALIDLSMPGSLSGLDLVRALRARGIRAAIVIMTCHRDPELAQAAFSAGAVGFVTKSDMGSTLLPVMRSATMRSSSQQPTI